MHRINILRTEVKFSLCLTNKAPHNEDVWERVGMASPFLTSAIYGSEQSASHANHHFTITETALVPTE
jgi:hypothetical protein